MSESPKHVGIIVLGHPRSGTTLLRRLLDRHPNIACPGETHIFSACARFLQSEETAEGVDMGVLTGLHFAGFSDEDVLRDLREFAFSFPRTHAKNKGKDRWADKTAFDSFFIEEIEKLCGDHVYFVGMVRHGLDVAVSTTEFSDATGRYVAPLHEYIRRYPEPLLAFTHSWVNVTEELLAFSERHEKNSVICRYEDLVAYPEDTMRAILNFIGEDYDEAIFEEPDNNALQLGFGDHKSYQRNTINADSCGRWTQLPDAIAQRMAAIANLTLEKCEYDAVPLKDKERLEDVRRRYALSLMIHKQRGTSDAN